MTAAYISLGSNVEPERNLCSGVAALRQRLGTLRLSPVYRSAAVGFDGAAFLNLAAAADTALSPLALRALLRAIEDEHQRDRSAPRFSDRCLDLDLVLYGDLVMATEELTLPRPDLLHHAHVLKPVCDLGGGLRHPLSGQTLAAHWTAMAAAAPPLVEVSLPV